MEEIFHSQFTIELIFQCSVRELIVAPVFTFLFSIQYLKTVTEWSPGVLK